MRIKIPEQAASIISLDFKLADTEWVYPRYYMDAVGRRPVNDSICINNLLCVPAKDKILVFDLNTGILSEHP